ncbi:MAG: hypothetical protein WA005_00425 [Candidatus Binataceae bacterium]
MVDLSTLPNPYDFANPVSDETLFFGRKTELAEIRYYLDLGKMVARPINLAILGPRASGKTSLLNMTEKEAERRGFCTVRVNLDEGDIQTELRFFHKLFDSVLTGACQHGAFGGTRARTYEIYLDMVNAYAVPSDPDHSFTPFLFPISYAKAMAAGNLQMPLSDFAYVNDLKVISQVTEQPILVLFDEGNVLARSRVHLEKLRNIFMNLSRFMIVITGTPDLFPVMDDVFSPMVRQFKRIVVREFKNRHETIDCVLEPLRKIRVPFSQIRQIAPIGGIQEIHELSNGRPYEVQLVCHVLFRRLQSRRAATMSLDLGALDEIRRELETSQSLAERPVLNQVRTLTPRELSALEWSLARLGAKFEDLWLQEYFLHGEALWKKDRLRQYVDAFVAQRLLRLEDGVLRFEGDDFEKLYVRYLARERRVKPETPEVYAPPEAAASFRVSLVLARHLELVPFSLPDASGELLELQEVLEALADAGRARDVFVEYPLSAVRVYFIMLRYRSAERIPMVEVSVSFPGCKASNLYYARDPGEADRVALGVTRLEEFRERCEEIGGDFAAVKRELPVVASGRLIQRREQTANRSLKASIIRQHVMEMAEKYGEMRDKDEALFHAKLACDSLADLAASEINNVGYVFLASEEFQRARELFMEAIRRYDSDPEQPQVWRQLPLYNLAITEIRAGNMATGLSGLELCVAQLGAKGEGEMPCSCLFIPRYEEGQILVDERFDEPDLKAVAAEALTNLKQALQ